MAWRTNVRASDADREQIAERLRHAAGEGRLLAEELEQRLEGAFSARTYGELDRLVADLPRQAVERSRRSRPARRIGPVPTVALIVLIPALIALVIAAVVVVATVFAAWALLLGVLWWFFGRGHGRSYRPMGCCKRLYAGGGRHARQAAGPRARPGSWV